VIQPEELTKDEPVFWSTGAGINVWKKFRASMSGDLETVKRRLDLRGC
jgi:hypothetical protein